MLLPSGLMEPQVAMGWRVAQVQVVVETQAAAGVGVVAALEPTLQVLHQILLALAVLVKF